MPILLSILFSNASYLSETYFFAITAAHKNAHKMNNRSICHSPCTFTSQYKCNHFEFVSAGNYIASARDVSDRDVRATSRYMQNILSYKYQDI